MADVSLEVVLVDLHDVPQAFPPKDAIVGKLQVCASRSIKSIKNILSKKRQGKVTSLPLFLPLSKLLLEDQVYIGNFKVLASQVLAPITSDRGDLEHKLKITQAYPVGRGALIFEHQLRPLPQQGKGRLFRIVEQQ